MSNDSCCICLDNFCDIKTSCCKNSIHKTCLINWFIYRGQFICPLCRNENIRVNIDEILYCQGINQYKLSHDTLTNNFNKLVNSYNLPYQIIIDIPEEYSSTHSMRGLCISRYIRYRYRYRICSYLLLIPIFYLLLFIFNIYIKIDFTHWDVDN